jgi:hypothetical protein
MKLHRIPSTLGLARRCATVSLLAAVFLSSEVFAGWSLAERSIRKKIPAYFAQNTGGPVEAPADADIAEALKLAEVSKENRDILDYAFTQKLDHQTPFGGRSISVYLAAKTPLFLVAQHTREKLREHRKINSEYVAYVRGLGLAKLEINLQVNFHPSFPAVILLRDGERVESVASLKSPDGRNPFALPNPAGTDAILAASAKVAAQYTRGLWSTMDDGRKKQAIISWRTMGYGDSQVMQYAGISEDELRRLEGPKPEGGNLADVQLTESSNIYRIEDLRKTGKYEIIFRSQSIIKGEGREFRYPITFDGVR